MTERDGGLIDGNAIQRYLNGEGVAEDMAAGALWGVVGILRVSDLEEPAMGTL